MEFDLCSSNTYDIEHPVVISNPGEGDFHICNVFIQILFLRFRNFSPPPS
jgi:hypothetical protein